MLAFCRAEYGAVELWRGRWPEAEALLEAAVRGLLAARARRGWRGPWPGSRSCAAARAGARTRWRCSTGRGRRPRRSSAAPGSRSSAAGRSRRPTSLARLLRRLPADRGLERAPALELLVHARAARGELDGRRRRPWRSCARRSGWPGPRRCAPAADLAEGVLAAAGGDHERARVLLEDAVDCFERSGAPFEAAQARVRARDQPDRARPRRRRPARGDQRPATASLELGADGAAGRARRLLGASRRQRPDHAARARRAAPARRRADQPADRRAAGRERAHRAPPRHQPAAQARRPVAHGRRGARAGRSRHARRARPDAAKMANSGDARAGRPP